MPKETHIWSFTGAAARAIGLFEAGKVLIEKGERPTAVIGQSSGAIWAPIAVVGLKCPEIVEAAIEFAQTLDVIDMFPYKNNFPLKKNGKPSANALWRLLTGHNHFAWQDIRPLFKSLFNEEHLKVLQESDVDCWGFGVRGDNGSGRLFDLKSAQSVDALVDMIQKTARIVPFVQHKDGYIDGGFAAFSPAHWLFEMYSNIQSVICVYSKELEMALPPNEEWDKSVLSITTRIIEITTHWIAYKDATIEELYCKANNIPYLRIECPNGYTDEIYETDDDQLKALGNASRDRAIKMLEGWHD